MQPDEFQQAWQSDAAQDRVTIDADLLRKEVQRNQQDFRATIARRDYLEVGVALLLLPVWIYMGITNASPWTWYLMIPALIWVAGYILMFRMRHKQDPGQPDDPLLTCVKRSLADVDDRIWLLRNVFWWYLLPLAIPLLAYTTHLAWLKSKDWLVALDGEQAFWIVFFPAIFCFLYYTIQRAVRVQLEPRRQELLTLLANFGDESTNQQIANESVEVANSPRLFRRWAIFGVFWLMTGVVVALAGGLFDSNYDQPAQSSGPEGDSLAKLVDNLREENNLVGLAAMVMVDGEVQAAAASGERKFGSGVPVETGDRWHLGGIGGSITATMIARLVEAGKMDWSDTLGEVFSDASIHEDWKPVTVRQLLTHSSGALRNFSLQVRRQQPEPGPECTQARREAVLDVIKEKPEHPPGTEYSYSNVGFTIAGAMAEQVTGETWENLVEREVFEPLSLSGAGFGPPKSPDATLDQPRGHRTFLRGKVAVADDADNTPIMGPSGTIHMTLDDLCTYATDHLQGELGEDQLLLSTETYKQLHTPELERYACGWVLQQPSDKIPHKVYWHNGSNTMWYALVVFIPDQNMVVAITSNDDDRKAAEAAAWKIVNAVSQQFKPEKDTESAKGLPTEAFPKKSPFSAVRWQDSQPEVRLDQAWFKLVSLDGKPATEIVTFSQQTYGELWKKRFEEDLVELLSKMGHPPQDTVTLMVESLTSGETSVRTEVPMTKANRQRIKAQAGISSN
ncbi:beta-lactamase family protein [Mariniblastus sp.]|nr:beta-lactamase family protein [Mariniblastus sp.]